MKDLTNAVALITGAGSGIGRSTALALAERRARIVAVDRDAARATAVAQAVEDRGGEALGIAFDVATDDFDQLKMLVLDRFGRVDVVMNNVGVITNGLPEAIPLAEWQRIIDVNLLSVVKSNITFLPLLIAQARGHIVNTASFAGLYTYAFDRTPYAACKAAIVQISEALALYVRPMGIGVTLLCPGPVRTDIAASVRSYGAPAPIRSPGAQFPLLEPDAVGAMVVQAILENRFMLPTDDAVRDLLVARAQDWDGFIQQQMDHPHIISMRGSPAEGRP